MRQTVTSLDQAIAGRLKELRTERGMAQPRVAEVLGISYQSYQKLEAGKTSFRASTLAKLAQLMGVSVQHFYDGYAAFMHNGTAIAHVSGIINDLSPDDAGEIVRFSTSIKARAQQNVSIG